RRLLVVDNEATNRKFITLLLSSVGFEILEASDGTMALELARREPPALLLTDLAMPNMTGLELARTIRADSQLARLPIIAVSASASTISRQQALAAGCNDFVPKPVKTDELFEAIGKLLSLEWQTSETAPMAPPRRRADLLSGVNIDSRWGTELY